MATDEQNRLLSMARSWFASHDQVETYTKQAPDGLLDFEQDAVGWLPTPPARILDIGCGAGRVTIPLCRKGYHVTGIDGSAPLVRSATQYAATEGITARFLVADSQTIPNTQECYDAAIMVRQYCYLPGRDLRIRYIRALIATLRPPRLIVLINHVVPNEDDAIDNIAADPHHLHAAAAFTTLEPLDTFSNGHGYVHWFTQHGLIDELTDAGLSIRNTLHSPDRLQVALALVPQE